MKSGSPRAFTTTSHRRITVAAAAAAALFFCLWFVRRRSHLATSDICHRRARATADAWLNTADGHSAWRNETRRLIAAARAAAPTKRPARHELE